MELTRRGFLCILDYQQWLGCLPLTGLSGWGYYVALGSSFSALLLPGFLLFYFSFFLGTWAGKIKKESQALLFIRSFYNFLIVKFK